MISEQRRTLGSPYPRTRGGVKPSTNQPVFGRLVMAAMQPTKQPIFRALVVVVVIFLNGCEER